jgi:phytoene desaturase
MTVAAVPTNVRRVLPGSSDSPDGEVGLPPHAGHKGAVFPGGGRKTAIVIGSGFGGLAAAVRLGAAGYQVTVLERLDTPGGRARVFRQDGFTFDAGPTIVTAPFLFEELWEMAGARLQDDVTLRPISPFYRIRFADGSHFDYSGDDTAMRAEIARFSPSDLAGYERFKQHTRQLCEVGFEQLGHVPFGSWRDMLRVLPQLLRLQAWRSVHGLVARYIRDPRLRTVFSFHPLLVGGNPFTTTAVYALINDLERRWGVHYAMGGTGQLVKGLVRLIEGQGGNLRCNSEVRQILVNQGSATGVMLADGQRLPADIVVSNADAAWTYRNLLPEGPRRRWTRRKLDRLEPSMSLFVWYFGTDRQYLDVPHHTIALGPRYRGLLDDIFNKGRLAEDFSLYLHRPSATDPGCAPQGCDAFYVLSPVPHLSSGIDWEIEGEPYRKRIEQSLQETLLPGLRDAVVTSRTMTPQHFRDELLSWQGAAFGPQPVLGQSAWFRPHNRSEEVAGLFLVGAGTHPGAGLPGVLSSAKVLERVMNQELAHG